MNQWTNRIVFGDCRESLRKMALDGVKAQMCVTSPPYFGLRDYEHAGQLGLEKTPEQYVAALVEVFSCVRDVLANDGTLWIVIGDSYARQAGDDSKKDPASQNTGFKNVIASGSAKKGNNRPPDGIKPKDLIGIPWMLAFALRADGWYLRQDIIWHKPNPMPESVRDRCTKAHEYLFLLSKSSRYFMDAEGLKEPSNGWPISGGKTRGKTAYSVTSGVVSRPQRDPCGGIGGDGETRNKRSVWTIATRPYKGAHFSVFPSALVEPCIAAGSRIGDIVLDPFMGSGTTAQAALKLGRRYLGCELVEDYKALQDQRIENA